MAGIYFERSFQRSFGTFPLRGEDLKAALRIALEVGYRSIDTAQMYGNEAEVGDAVAEAGVARDALCITTKVHPDNFSPAAFLPSVEASLKALRLDQTDVLLLHWPPLDGDVSPSLKLLDEARRHGLARHVGVSNYTADMMRRARDAIGAPVVTNQVEFHPLLDQGRLLAAARETGIPLASYCSVARGEVFKHPLFAEIGSAYGRTAGQVVLRWILQKGVSINTMSTRRENIAANFDVMDFTLSSIDMDRIEAMNARNFRIVGKDLVPWAPDWD